MFLIGSSTDIHKIEFKKNAKQKLAGITFDLDYKIIANSDGDIIFHAISNAILGAIGDHDIGYYFVDNKTNTNLNSFEILKKSLEIMKDNNYAINNIDITFISQHIMIENKREKIIASLKNILEINFISIKGTRWEEDKLFVQCNCIILLKNN